MTRSDAPLGLYLHVPFCASRCPYCDFYSHCDPALIPAYGRALEAAVRAPERLAPFAGAELRGRRVSSVYFGGGTPSLLSPETVAALLRAARETFSLEPAAEITLEANPSLREPEAYFAAAAAAGVNRVSLGLQSAVDRERRALGRVSGREAAARCIKAAKAAGIAELSLDLMLGIPGQTPETLDESAEFCLEAGARHISAYLLKIEPGTVFDRRRETLDLPDDDAAAELYLRLCDRLRAAGWRHYEISNFCKEDRVSRHNLLYWQNGEYLGYGPAAHSYYHGRRFYFAPSVEAFLAGAPCEYEGEGGGAEERLMLALRTDLGLELPGFAADAGLEDPRPLEEQARALAAGGLAEYGGGRLRLTDRGMLVSNAVILSLLELIST